MPSHNAMIIRRHAAKLIRQVRADAAAGACQAARQGFERLIPLIGTRSTVRIKHSTVRQLWKTVGACRWKGR